LIETIVASAIFGVVAVLAVALLVNISALQRRIDTDKILQEETRLIMERIVKEIRGGTIDYEEYWNNQQSGTIFSGYGNFGNFYTCYQNSGSGCAASGAQRYGEYKFQFYDDVDNNHILDTAKGDRNLGRGPDALLRFDQNELYLISSSGDERTYLRMRPDVKGVNRLQILKLTGKDYGLDHDINVIDTDGSSLDKRIDTWICAKDFSCSGNLSGVLVNKEFAPFDKDEGWVEISPSEISIEELKFYTTPLKDPRKAFDEVNNAVQMQPKITVTIVAELSELARVTGEKAPFSFQTTVTTREYKEMQKIKNNF